MQLALGGRYVDLRAAPHTEKSFFANAADSGNKVSVVLTERVLVSLCLWPLLCLAQGVDPATAAGRDAARRQGQVSHAAQARGDRRHEEVADRDIRLGDDVQLATLASAAKSTLPLNTCLSPLFTLIYFFRETRIPRSGQMVQ